MKKNSKLLIMIFILAISCTNKNSTNVAPSVTTMSAPVNLIEQKNPSSAKINIARKNSDIKSAQFGADANEFVIYSTVDNADLKLTYKLNCVDSLTAKNIQLEEASVNNVDVKLTIERKINVSQISSDKIICTLFENDKAVTTTSLPIVRDLVIDSIVSASSLKTKEKFDAIIIKNEGAIFIEDKNLDLESNYFYAEKGASIQTFYPNSNLRKNFRSLKELNLINPELLYNVSFLNDQVNNGRSAGKINVKTKNAGGMLSVSMVGENADSFLKEELPAPIYRPKKIVDYYSNQDSNLEIEETIEQAEYQKSANGKNGGNSGSFNLIIEKDFDQLLDVFNSTDSVNMTNSTNPKLNALFQARKELNQQFKLVFKAGKGLKSNRLTPQVQNKITREIRFLNELKKDDWNAEINFSAITNNVGIPMFEYVITPKKGKMLKLPDGFALNGKCFSQSNPKEKCYLQVSVISTEIPTKFKKSDLGKDGIDGEIEPSTILFHLNQNNSEIKFENNENQIEL